MKKNKFECVYYEHGTLQLILRCSDCGSVLFCDESENYILNLDCPVCNPNYIPEFKYVTSEDISKDERLRNMINFYEKMEKERIEAEERQKRRNGLSDYEIFKTTKNLTKKYKIEITLKKYSGYKEKLKGVYFHIIIFKNKNGMYFSTKIFNVPITPYAIYLQWIYRYTNKCNKSIRKYLPWQKKPENMNKE